MRKRWPRLGLWIDALLPAILTLLAMVVWSVALYLLED